MTIPRHVPVRVQSYASLASFASFKYSASRILPLYRDLVRSTTLSFKSCSPLACKRSSSDRAFRMETNAHAHELRIWRRHCDDRRLLPVGGIRGRWGQFLSGSTPLMSPQFKQVLMGTLLWSKMVEKWWANTYSWAHQMKTPLRWKATITWGWGGLRLRILQL